MKIERLFAWLENFRTLWWSATSTRGELPWYGAAWLHGDIPLLQTTARRPLYTSYRRGAWRGRGGRGRRPSETDSLCRERERRGIVKLDFGWVCFAPIQNCIAIGLRLLQRGHVTALGED